MPEYNIYNPCFETDTTLSFFVGEGGYGLMVIPNNIEAIRLMLKAIGINQEPSSHHVFKCRNYYYSEYIDDTEKLEDQWSNGMWFIQVSFANSSVTKVFKKNEYPVDSLIDLETESIGIPGKNDIVKWFIIADFKKEQDYNQTQEKLSQEFEDLKLTKGFSFSIDNKKFIQMRIEIGEFHSTEYLLSGKQDREKIMQICEENNGALNISHLNY